MDFSKMKKSEKLIGLGAAVGVIAAFLPWYSWSYSFLGASSGASINGFTSWWTFSFIAALAALLMIALPMFGTKLPKFGIDNNSLYKIFGAITGGVPILALLSGASRGLSGFGGSIGPGFGLWIAIIGGALILVGAFMEKKDGVRPSTSHTHSDTPSV